MLERNSVSVTIGADTKSFNAKMTEVMRTSEAAKKKFELFNNTLGKASIIGIGIGIVAKGISSVWSAATTWANKAENSSRRQLRPLRHFIAS